MMHTDLDDVIEAARAGSRPAFDELMRRTYTDTYTLALRLVSNEDDARDVTQEAYLRAYRGLATFRGDAQFSTWLYRITANCASSYLGRRARHRHDELRDDLHIVDRDATRDPQLRNDAEALRSELVLALRSLPPKLRAVVVLRDIYDLSHDQISAELGISESAAKVRLHRARRKLREGLLPLAGDANVESGTIGRRAHAM